MNEKGEIKRKGHGCSQVWWGRTFIVDERTDSEAGTLGRVQSGHDQKAGPYEERQREDPDQEARSVKRPDNQNGWTV